MKSYSEFSKWYEENIGDENKPVREAALEAWNASRLSAVNGLENFLLSKGSAMSTVSIASAWLIGNFD